jgi:hypothetical protein
MAKKYKAIMTEEIQYVFEVEANSRIEAYEKALGAFLKMAPQERDSHCTAVSDRDLKIESIE